MKVLLDVNIVLDVLLNRAPWVADSAATWDAHRAGDIVAHVAAFAVPTVFYVMRRHSDLQRAHEGVRICLESLEIAPVSRSTLELARRQTGSDYEDNLQIAAAEEAGLEAIVSRDPAGFAHSPIPVLTPAELLQRLAAAKKHSTAGPSSTSP
jgi:predicted nucleic acid-binding protein